MIYNQKFVRNPVHNFTSYFLKCSLDEDLHNRKVSLTSFAQNSQLILFYPLLLVCMSLRFRFQDLNVTGICPALNICPAHNIVFPSPYKVPVINLVCSLPCSIWHQLTDVLWRTAGLFFLQLHTSLTFYRLTCPKRFSSRLFVSTDTQECLNYWWTHTRWFTCYLTV
jgi:hypothetical protein